MNADRRPDLEFADRPVTVVGLGIEGVDLARFLCRQRALVTVSDSRTREQLAGRLDEIADLPVALSLGSAQEADLAADGVFQAQPEGLRLTNQVRGQDVSPF